MVKMFELNCNPQITNARISLYRLSTLIRSRTQSSMLVGISEAIRLLFFKLPIDTILSLVNQSYIRLSYFSHKPSENKELVFNQWLAGLIDGKEEIQDIIEYFTVCPSRTGKQHRLKLVPKYLELRKLQAHLAPETSIYGKAWKILLSQWNRYKFKE